MPPDNDNDNPELDGPAPTPSEMGQPDQEPDADDMGPGASQNELCVPLESLAMPGEDDAMEKPAVGDKAQANIEYTVTRVEGPQAYVTVDAVNGTKLPAPKAAPSDDEQFAALQNMASQMPESH